MKKDLKRLLEMAGLDEAVGDWAQSLDRSVEDEMTGNSYSIQFEDRNGEETMFVEANGITVAMATVGGGGLMNTKISKPDLLMDAISAFANNNHR